MNEDDLIEELARALNPYPSPLAWAIAIAAVLLVAWWTA